MFTWVVLGFICRVAELNVKVDAEDGVVAMVPRDWGERRGKGLTTLFYLFTGLPACSYRVALFHLPVFHRESFFSYFLGVFPDPM